MPVSDHAVTRTVRLSTHLSVEITLSMTGCACEWDPALRRLTRAEERRYLNARNACASELARKTHQNIAVADVDSKGISNGIFVCFSDGRIEHRRSSTADTSSVSQNTVRTLLLSLACSQPQTGR